MTEEVTGCGGDRTDRVENINGWILPLNIHPRVGECVTSGGLNLGGVNLGSNSGRYLLEQYNGRRMG